MEPDDFGDNVTTLGLIAVGGSVTGRLNSSTDKDWFRFTAVAGQAVKFDIPSTELGGLALIVIYDQAGNKVAGFTQSANYTYVFPSGGSFYIGVSHQIGALGNYTLSSQIVPDDHPGTLETSRSITLNNRNLGTIDFSGDKDVFRIETIVDTPLNFFFDTLPQSGITFAVYDSFGANIFGDNTVLSTLQSPFIPNRSGTYFIEISQQPAGSGGNYSFKVNQVIDDFKGSRDTSGVLTLNGAAVSVRDDYRNDLDFLAISIATPGLVRFELPVSRNRAEYEVGIFDATGTLLADSYLAVSGQGFDYNFTTAGTYYFASVRTIGTTGAPSYTVRAITLADDFSEQIGTNPTITPNASAISGQINYGQDLDLFRFTAERGQTYLFDVTSPNFNHVVSFYNSDGFLLSSPQGVLDLDPYFTFSKAGTYYAAVSALENSEVGSYTLAMSRVADDNTSANRGTLAIGGTASSRREFQNDTEEFVFSVNSRQTLAFSASGSEFYELMITDMAGEVVAFSDIGNNAPTLHYSFDVLGQYVLTYIQKEEKLGTISVSSSVTADDFSDKITTLGAIALNGPAVAGAIQYRQDKDWFKFTATAGDRINLNVSFADGSTGVSTLELEELSSGYYIPAVESIHLGANFIAYDIKETGTYYVQVGPTNNGHISAYTVNAKLVPDDYKPTTGTSGRLQIDGTATQGTLDYGFDKDWFAVDLTAGDVFEFKVTGQDLTNREFLGALAMFNKEGIAIDVYQPGVVTDKLMYTAEYTGVHYIQVNAQNDNSTYSVTATRSFGDPLEAISTGRRLMLHGAYDRDVDAIFAPLRTPSRIVDLYFGRGGESFGVTKARSWLNSDIQSVMSLLQQISNAVDIEFRVTDFLPKADLAMFRYSNEESSAEVIRGNQANAGVPLLGFSTQFSFLSGDGMNIGGLGAAYVLNSIGFGLGLAFPHTTDGNTYRFPGVTESGDLGRFGLNQGIYTIMSFNDGWSTNAALGAHPGNVSGYQAGPMAFDLAALQKMYGANTTTASGANAYELADANGSGVGWRTIWDTNGIDQVLYNGTRNATIDLRAATLTYADGGAGRPSWVAGVHGGFTIAAGVLIENATAGSGDDLLTGNIGNNALQGQNGNDTLNGGSAGDTLNGGEGLDGASYLSASNGVTAFLGAAQLNTGDGAGDTYFSIENLFGSNFADILGGTAGANLIEGGGGNDVLYGSDGNDSLDGGSGLDNLDGQSGFDFASYANASTALTVYMGGGTFNSGEANGDTHTSIEGLIGSNFADILGGSGENNELRGLGGNDWIYGQAGNDTLLGGAGNDVLSGGAGGDRLEGGDAIDVAFYRDATVGLTASLLSGGTTGEAAGDTFANIENIWGSDFDDVLSGDNGGGQVYGFAGNDNLSGLDGDDFFYGSVGLDTMTGGNGVDNFFFLSWNDHFNQYGTLEAYEGGDTFTDFTVGTDRIILSRYWFGFGNIQGPAAALTDTHANFVTNGTPTSARPSLIWNAGNRTLSFDADGNGATQAVLLGTFQAGAALTLNDIWTA